MTDPAGYTIKGDLSLELDPGFVLDRKIIARYLTEPAAFNNFMVQIEKQNRIIARLIPRTILKVH